MRKTLASLASSAQAERCLACSAATGLARRLAWRALPVQIGRLCGSESQRVLTAAARGACDLLALRPRTSQLPRFSTWEKMRLHNVFRPVDFVSGILTSAVPNHTGRRNVRGGREPPPFWLEFRYDVMTKLYLLQVAPTPACPNFFAHALLSATRPECQLQCPHSPA